MLEHRTLSLAEQVFDRLETDILSGKYQQGELLTEMKLVSDLGVSRTPIREALRRLEQERIIEITLKGILIRGVTQKDLIDILSIRMRVEGLAAYEAAKNITDEQLAQLLELTELQRYYINKQGNSRSENIKNLDSQFHELLYRCSGSNAYTDVLMRIHKKMTKYRKASVSQHSRAQQSNDEHMAIYQALASHDPDAAEKAVLIHVDNAMKRMEHMEQTESAEN